MSPFILYAMMAATEVRINGDHLVVWDMREFEDPVHHLGSVSILLPTRILLTPLPDSSTSSTSNNNSNQSSSNISNSDNIV